MLLSARSSFAVQALVAPAIVSVVTLLTLLLASPLGRIFTVPAFTASPVARTLTISTVPAPILLSVMVPTVETIPESVSTLVDGTTLIMVLRGTMGEVLFGSVIGAAIL